MNIIPIRKEPLLTIYPFGNKLSSRFWIICKIFFREKKERRMLKTYVAYVIALLPFWLFGWICRVRDIIGGHCVSQFRNCAIVCIANRFRRPIYLGCNLLK